jgi:hypothetical protein
LISRTVVLHIVVAAEIALCFTHVAAAAPYVPTPRPAAYLALVTHDAQGLPGDTTAAFASVTVPDPVVRWMLDQVKQDKIRQYESDLTGQTPVSVRGSLYQIRTRNTYSQMPIQNATYYVGDHLAGLGLDLEYHTWGPATAPNVVAQKTGATRPGDIFMVTAHLDDMPTGPAAPGADDNASGSAAVLVAADILSQFKWDCTLRFALWTGEEQGLLGSEKYAQRAWNNGENIAAVFNLDTIGWNTPDSPRDIDLHANSSMPATIDLANQAASIVKSYGLALVPEVRADGTGSGDHASFWKHGYAAILGMEDYYPNNHDFNKNDHTTHDALSTLDLGYLTEYVKLAVAETAHMAGCLTTGTVGGQVVASHDSSPVGNAELDMRDAAGREYTLQGSADGRYTQTVPPQTYSATVSAYGYRSSSATGIAISANGSALKDFVLTAATPAAPEVSVTLDAGQILLAWQHVSPNTAYEVHGSDVPYFLPVAGTRLATVNAAHPPGRNETLTYPGTGSAAGALPAGQFYLVVGTNAAGAGAASPRAGEFRFDLISPAGP